MGLTVDIRPQSEENDESSKHRTAKKRKKTCLTMCPCPCLGCPRSSIPGIEQETSQSQKHRLTARDWPSLTKGCSGMGLVFWSDIFPQKVATQFSVCCGMLRHAAACFKTPTIAFPLAPDTLNRGLLLANQREETLPMKILWHELV